LTEVDVLGVRFPFSCEFQDDSHLAIPKNSIDVVFAEAKRMQIRSLNGPWSSPAKGALDYVLQRTGVVPTEDIQGLAHELYMRRKATRGEITVRILCLGESISEELRTQGVAFVAWSRVTQFIHGRFYDNDKVKADHQAWDGFGQYLWRELSKPNPVAPDALFDEWEKQEASLQAFLAARCPPGCRSKL
jgi:hypothetical protein